MPPHATPPPAAPEEHATPPAAPVAPPHPAEGPSRKAWYTRGFEWPFRQGYKLGVGFYNRVAGVMGAEWHRLRTMPERTWAALKSPASIDLPNTPGQGGLSHIRNWAFTRVLRTLALAGIILTAPISAVEEAAGTVADTASAIWHGKAPPPPNAGHATPTNRPPPAGNGGGNGAAHPHP